MSCGPHLVLCKCSTAVVVPLDAHHERSTAQDSMWTRLCTRACRLASVPPFPSRLIFPASKSCTCTRQRSS
jgi:hypothetical protein